MIDGDSRSRVSPPHCRSIRTNTHLHIFIPCPLAPIHEKVCQANGGQSWLICMHHYIIEIFPVSTNIFPKSQTLFNLSLKLLLIIIIKKEFID